MLEDENVAANIFIEPNGGDVTDEDSGEEDGGGFLNNLSGKQLNAPAELVISSSLVLIQIQISRFKIQIQIHSNSLLN